VINDSSGNGGSSLAGYAAAAGMPCRILVPEHTSRAKVVQMGAYGAEVTPIKGSRQDVVEAALKAAETAFYASHNWQPFFLQGTKTLAYEIWEQLGFRAPDNVVVPVGGGSNLIGCHLGFSELLGRGEIGRLPRLFGVQAAAAAPLHRTFVEGADDLVPTEIGPTIAEGIAMARPVRAREAMAALRASRGRTVAVTEAEIVAALRALARQGVFVEPTSAAAAAGLTQLIDAGDVEDGETTVLVLTGSGLKATEYVGRALGLGAGTR
jgi:threonine synthase